jgi:hypothetical protein
VRNDQAGLITIQVGTANPIVGNHAMAVFINADKNRSTGGDGDEYWMVGGPDVGVGFFAWNGSSFALTNPASFSVGAAAANVTEFRFNRADIGNVTGFEFVVISVSFDGDQIKFWDAAPNSGYFTYDLSFPQCSNGKDDDGDGKTDSQDLGCSSTTDDNEADDPVTIRLGAAKVVPARPKAGKTVVVSVPTTRVETSQPLDGGTVACTAKVAGKTLKGSGSVASGKAVCRFKVPAKTKGKTVRGTVVVTYQTATARAAFAFKVA